MVDTTGSVRYFNRDGEDYLTVLDFMGDAWMARNTQRFARWERVWSALRQSFFSRHPEL